MALLLLVLAPLAGCSRRPAANPEFVRSLAAARATKDSILAQADGPLTPEQRQIFRGLRYWDADPRYVCSARLERAAKPDTIQFPTSQHTFDPYLRVGRLHFQLRGRELVLTLYESLDGGHAFVPFTDRTSGSESYGAGRYMDVDVAPDGRVELDFNRAYNPYCAYNSGWICPLAPPENFLDARIAAGERMFPGGH